MFYLLFMNAIYRWRGRSPHYKRYIYLVFINAIFIEIPYKVYNFRNTLKV